jgi:phosphoglycolate phosphatase
VLARAGDQASGGTPVSLVCCGLIGTLVADNGMIDRAYTEAIATQGVVTGTAAYARCMARVHQTRGEAAADVLQILFPDSQARGQAANLAFDRACMDAIDRMGVTPIPGAAAAIDSLARVGLRICVVAALSRRVLAALLDALGWQDSFDLVVGPDDVPRGAPWPDLVLSAMLRLGVGDVRETAVVQGTESGILCGRRSGAGIVAGVLTGPHTRQRLKRAGATHLMPSIAYLPELIGPAADNGPGAVEGAQPASRLPESGATRPADG